MALSLTYDLEGAGWATAQICDGEQRFEITISYLHDSLRELAEAARTLRDGAQSAQVFFMDEPGEVQLLLSRTDEDLVYELRGFEGWSSWGKRPDEKYKTLHQGVTTVPRFLAEVRKELAALLNQHGEAGYKRKWGPHVFPMELLKDLQRIPGPNERLYETVISPVSDS